MLKNCFYFILFFFSFSDVQGQPKGYQRGLYFQGKWIPSQRLDSLYLQISRQPDEIKFEQIMSMLHASSPSKNVSFLDAILYGNRCSDYRNYDMYKINSERKRKFYTNLLTTPLLGNRSDIRCKGLMAKVRSTLDGSMYKECQTPHGKKSRGADFTISYHGLTLKGSQVDSLKIVLSSLSDSAFFEEVKQMMSQNSLIVNYNLFHKLISSTGIHYRGCYKIYDVSSKDHMAFYTYLYDTSLLVDLKAESPVCRLLQEIISGRFYQKVHEMGCDDFSNYLF